MTFEASGERMASWFILGKRVVPRGSLYPLLNGTQGEDQDQHWDLGFMSFLFCAHGATDSSPDAL